MNVTTKADGAAIRRLREAKGMHGYELADAAGIDKRHLSKIELGRQSGSAPTRYRIAQALGCDLSEITYTAEVPAPRRRPAEAAA